MRLAAFVVAFGATGCAGTEHSSSPQHDAASILADGGASDGALPACHWPSTVLPVVPDGGVAAGSVARAYLFCGGVPFDGGIGASELCVSESSSTCTPPDGGAFLGGPPDELCVMACMPAQYAVLTLDPFSYERGIDADVIFPQAPGGCTGVQSSFAKAVSRVGSSEPLSSLQCCPCQ